MAAGLLVALITACTSYSHVDLFGFLQFKVNQQIGIPLLLAAMAALFGEDVVFCEGVVKLASNHRRADQRARERDANEVSGDNLAPMEAGHGRELRAAGGLWGPSARALQETLGRKHYRGTGQPD